ncbi:hypothetical protein BRC63_07015 [Halobacteriales archaeon QH_10_70_21]|nr:MAG: hypothetical protein BRC63_07015 [Halobacteriales archaeon QH_10_70_21]
MRAIEAATVGRRTHPWTAAFSTRSASVAGTSSASSCSRSGVSTTVSPTAVTTSALVAGNGMRPSSVSRPSGSPSGRQRVSDGPVGASTGRIWVRV